MKRILAIVLCIVLTATLFSCSSADNTASESASAVSQTTASEEASPSEEATESAAASEETAESSSGEAVSEGEVLKRVIDNGKLTVLTNAAFPPYEYLGSDNKPAGVDVDITQAIADQIGVKLDVVDMDFDGLIPALTSGKGDLVAAGMTVTEERQLEVDFSDSYADATQMIIVPKDGATVAGEDDLAGKTVGVQLGTTGDLWVTENAENADIKQYKSGLEAAQDLKNGRLDAIVLDKLPAENIVASNDDLEIIEMESTNEQYAIAIQKNNEDLVAIVNEVIGKLIADGTIADYTATHVEASKVD